MPNKYTFIVVIIFFLFVIFIAVRGKEDTWICQNGQWVMHGKPTGAIPTYFCDK